MAQAAWSARSASAPPAMTTMAAVIGCLTAGVGEILGGLQGWSWQSDYLNRY